MQVLPMLGLPKTLLLLRWRDQLLVLSVLGHLRLLAVDLEHFAQGVHVQIGWVVARALLHVAVFAGFGLRLARLRVRRRPVLTVHVQVECEVHCVRLR